MSEIRNAIIRSTTLGVEDHGILSFMVHLDYSGGGQGFGGYCMDEPIKVDGDSKGRRGTAFGMECVRRILDTLGVRSWEKLPGTTCRVESDVGQVYRIGHFLKDKWFDPKALAADFYGEPVAK